MKRTTTSILIAASLVAATVLSISPDAHAQWDNCNGGSSYGGTCFGGTSTSGNKTINVTSTAGFGVYGNDTSSGSGVGGFTATGSGVYGYSSSSGEAFYGYSTSGYGIYAQSGTGDGGHFYVNNGNSAVAGINNYTSGNAIYGQATGGGWAGNFDGNVQVESGYSYCYNGSCTGTNCIGGSCASDQRLKKNIEPLHGALDQLLRLRGVTYEWI